MDDARAEPQWGSGGVAEIPNFSHGFFGSGDVWYFWWHGWPRCEHKPTYDRRITGYLVFNKTKIIQLLSYISLINYRDNVPRCLTHCSLCYKNLEQWSPSSNNTAHAQVFCSWSKGDWITFHTNNTVIAWQIQNRPASHKLSIPVFGIGIWAIPGFQPDSLWGPCTRVGAVHDIKL